MLVGAHPSDLKGLATDEEIAHDIYQARLLTHTPEWHGHVADLSPNVQALVHGLMHPDPDLRLTAEQLLASDWLRGKTTSSRKIANSGSTLGCLQKVSDQGSRAVLQVHETNDAATTT